MKKTYNAPQTLEIHLNISSIICTSGLGISDKTTTEESITTADSRSFHSNVWDDEEDEEDY